MVATFVIFLREGIEASMVAAILSAYLTKIGQRSAIRYVIAGMGSAALLAALAGVAIYFTVEQWADTRAQVIFETAMFLLAAAVLTSMSVWMVRHAHTLGDDLRDRAEGALSKGERRGLFFLSFQATGREGLEAAVFTLAIVFSPGGKGALLGAALGLLVAAGLAIAVFRFGVKIPLKRFFSVVSKVLLIFGAALVSNAVLNLQELGWISFLNQPMWNSSALVSDTSQVGDFLHAFFGYTASPTPLQAIAWFGYLIGASMLLKAERHKIGLRRPVRASV